MEELWEVGASFALCKKDLRTADAVHGCSASLPSHHRSQPMLPCALCRLKRR